jgi:two-component system phosphate regulon sensor histidine kinase PhoR
MAHSLQRVGIGTLLLCGIGAVLLGLGVLLLDIAPGLRWLLLLLVGMLWTGLCLWHWRRRVRAYIEQWLPGVLERLGRVSGGALAVRFSEAEFPEELRALAVELNRLTGAVETQLSRVRTLERSHTELLGTLAHELRNPLFLLRGSVETALDSSDSAQREHLLQKSLQHIARMERLLEQLLELSRLESGTLPLRWRSIRLAPLCTELCNHFSLLAAQHEVTLHVEVPEELEVLADRDRLEQVLANLLENAIKYNRPGGQVWLRAQPQEQYVLISVEDTGIGIPPEHQERVFERFYRVRERPVQGSGLGLAIVRHILQAHGARYELQSQPGVGTVVRFWLRR